MTYVNLRLNQNQVIQYPGRCQKRNRHLEFLSCLLTARTTLEIVVTLTWSQMTTGAVSGLSAAGKNQKNMLPLLGASTVSSPE